MNLIAHFFACSNVMMVLVYATSWVGFTILDGVPNASKYSLRRKIFDIGVSWGALAMLFAAILCIALNSIIHKICKVIPEKIVFSLTQLVSAVVLLQTYSSDSFKSIFIILPICGLSFSTFH